MSQADFEARVKIQQIIENQLPEFILDESPLTSEFLKQYYISQEYQGGPVDILENIDQYIKLDNLTPEVIVGSVDLASNISSSSGIITVTSTKGFPQNYGLLKIDDEIITYTGITTNTFTGCIRGFSGVSNYHQNLNSSELVFSESSATSHQKNAEVQNLSSLFLKEFYKKIKYSLTPGLENIDFVSDLNVGNFIKEARTLYESKGTDESFRILFNILFGENPRVIDLEQFLIKPSGATYLRRDVVVVDAISGNPLNLEGQTITKNGDPKTTASVSEVETIGRNGKTYYKLLLFVGYDEAFPSITGNFDITGSTKNTKEVFTSDTVITVDSTIGFPESGKIYSGNNTITYTNKSINQFFGCSGIIETISPSSLIRSDETYYGYENGDLTKKVEFRITGVLSDYKTLTENSILEEGEYIGIKNIGESIENPITSKTYKQVFANSWIYNTQSEYTNSTNIALEYNKITSNVQNVYNENDEYMYVASNSLPSYNITNKLFSYNASGVNGYDVESDSYTIITFNEKISFITGNEVYYKSSSSSIKNLEEGYYFVEVISDTEIKLYYSRSVIESSDYIKFGSLSEGIHTFTLRSQKEKVLSPQKILRKFPLSVNIGNDESEETLSGSTGILINGVEILNYKSEDKIYYGPLEKINVLNGGSDYDVINPPSLVPSTGNAKIQPVVKGSVKKVYVDPQEFDIDVIVSIALTGGNGKGASFKPVIQKRRREIQFDARQIEFGGGIDVTNETISFNVPHGLIRGETIVYRPDNNPLLGIGTYKGSNLNTGNTLKKDSIYYVGFINDKTIQLYNSLSDCNSGINTVGFTTIGTSGIQKFATDPKNTLTGIEVLNGGENYTSKEIKVSPVGISTINDTITFKNHGLESGEIITYTYQTTSVSGLSSTNQYYVIKLNSNQFRLSDAGIGATIRSNYERGKYVSFSSTGSGYQIFNYPQINLSVEYCAVGLGSTQFKGTINAVPVIRGEISAVNVYEYGSDYGSTILNLHKKPTIQVKTGKNAQLFPIIIDGKITKVSVQYSGTEYYSMPDIEVIGSGKGAILRPVIQNQKITEVIIENGGSGYSSDDTILKVNPTGKNAIFDPQVRSLVVNNNILYNDKNDSTKFANEIISQSYNNLQYRICGYSKLVQNAFNDDGSKHSPIIGWAYDGNPIYGAYGYSDPDNINSDLKALTPGYTLNTENIENRPSGFVSGFFVNDYKFTNSGDLDYYNGRYCITPEFPNGVYAYFSTITTDSNSNVVGQFPYFIGNEYRSRFITDNKTLNQSFNFNNSNLTRNVYPYISDSNYIANNFVSNSDNYVSSVESVFSGSIDDLEIINSGDNYKVGDTLEFDESQTNGSGLNAIVSEVNGKEIIKIETSNEFYDNAIFTWKNGNEIEVKVEPKHDLKNLDFVTTSGFTTSLSQLNETNQINVTSYFSILTSDLPSSGIVTDIYVSNIPESISIGSSIGIGTETLKVLNVYNGIIRVIRGNTGISHTATTTISFIPDTFTIGKSLDYFESEVNDLIYFNPTQSVGVGTTSGIGIAVTNNIGIQTNNVISIPTQSIYLPNHPFKTNQEVIFTKPSSASAISVANTSGSTAFNLPSSGNSQTVYIIKKSVDHIGIVTQIGLTTTTSGLFFINNGSNDYQYSLQSNFTQVKGDVEKIVTQVSVSTSHELTSGDTINLSVKPNLSVGIGTSTAVRINYNQTYNKLLVNPLSLTGNNVSGVGISSQFSYTLPTRVATLNTAVGIAWTAGAISPTATRNTQQVYDYIWDNYNQFDIDGDGVVSYNDGFMIISYLFGQPNITTGITFPQNAIRTTNATCYARCGIVSSYFDVDGNGLTQPLADGLLLARFASAPGDDSPSSQGYNVAPAVKNSGNVLYIPSHGFKTGDKIFLDYFINNKKEYFVYKIDKDTINICETYNDCISSPPITVNNFSFTTATIAPINPEITSVKNNNLVFDLTDSSLSGYNFKIFYDQDFKDEFVSTGSTSTFSVSGVGTVGVSTNASLTINYSEGLPSQLFYTLEKSGYISTADKEVQNYSQINFIDSYYNGSYKISGVGTTTFSISLTKSPEKNSYIQSECDVLSYTTNSTTVSGGVSKIKTISSGYNYKKLPIFTKVVSDNGSGAYIKPISNKIGKINSVKILDEGYEYSSDKTLKPDSYISDFVSIKNSNYIKTINIENGGNNYITEPKLVIIDSITKETINSGSLNPILQNGSIFSVDILDSPKGLSETPVTIKAINNTNGVSIQSIKYSSSGIVTCYLSTPLNGFSIEPFSNGDKIFVEGIQKDSSEGTGFNSEDYGYEFFEVKNYQGSGGNQRRFEYDLSKLTINAGILKTSDNIYGTVINYKNYPTFIPIQDSSDFILNEKLLLSTAFGYQEIDLKVVKSNKNYIKVLGSYNLQVNDIIKGSRSGSIATINEIKVSSGHFIVEFSSRKNIGWLDNTGKLNEDTQVIPDNNYYQNLSYTIKSNQDWSTIVSPVNGILHTSGLKNFADTQIMNSTSIEINSNDFSDYLYNIIDEFRVDSINNFDLSRDVDNFNSTSKLLEFSNHKFTDYIECITNRVLDLDDISFEFSTSDSKLDPFLVLDEIIPSKKYNKYLVQVTNNDSSQIQFTELVVLSNGKNIYTLEKGSLDNITSASIGYNSNQIANIYGYVDELEQAYLRFDAIKDPYDTSYNIKYLNTSFENYSSGIGTTSIGFIDLISSTNTVSSGLSTVITSKHTGKIKSIYSEINLIDNITNEMNYVELYIDHDGTNTNISEFYFDTNDGSSSNFIGSFGASISPGGILSLNYTNTSTNSVTVRSKNVGFGTTAIGIGTYRFKFSAQPDDTEKTVKYDALYSNVSSASTIISFDKAKISSIKSIVRIGIGSTSSLHQVMMICDSTNTQTLQYPFLSIGSTTGIGTFGGEINGGTASLKFYPDNNISGNFEILSFNQSFYSENDYNPINQPPNLIYNNINESFGIKKYFAINDEDTNKLNFDLTYNNQYIFKKVFDPSDTKILTPSTGEFNIDHFFSTGEEIIYRPKSTFVGVATQSMVFGSSTDLDTINPVYAIKISSNKFKVASTKNNALSGIALTFTSIGSGNAHEFEMVKKNEKSIITINNVIQSPISYSLLSYNVNNGTNIGVENTIFGLSGISSIIIGDILKIDDEYMKITNVGLGTTYSGPISFGGTFPLVEVKRAFVGSASSIHTNGSGATIYRGSYNIVGNEIYFTEAPDGNVQDQLNVDLDNLTESRATFNGRIFLKKDYTENQIYDNITERFTGIGQTYTLTVGGANTVGLGTSGGSGIVLINGIFQAPTTDNNIDNNFRIIENTGISSIVFSGIRSETGSGSFISQSDVNMNQLPKGGLIVSLGSTPGLGYAPLVGASVTAIVSGGVITSIGIGTTGNWGSGYKSPVSIAVTESGGSGAVINAIVGTGGTLSFNIVDGGTGYNNPSIIIPSPSYQNLSVTGVSRIGIGSTTDTGVGLLINVEVGSSSTTGIGSTLFEVKNFKVVRSGYGFKKGDVIKPVGLVTAYGLQSPLSEFELTVLEVFNDSFSAWQFGKLDYIDSIKNLQNGTRTRFPLYYNSQLLSFEKGSGSESELIDMDSLLIIFINGILQNPKTAYEFNGGTTFNFVYPPKKEDNISIFFYRGSSSDSQIVNSTESLKVGDSVQLISSNSNLKNTITQNSRIVSGIVTSDTIQTELYNLQGIDTQNYKPVIWTKQKVDKVINGEFVSKSRDSIESQIYPTAKIIKNITSTDSEIFVDNAQFFNYENVGSPSFDGLIISGSVDAVSAAVTAVVSTSGTIQSLVIGTPGSGYTGSFVDVKISAPIKIGVGIGTTATALATVGVGGTISSISIVNPGFGYTTSIVPQVIIPLPKAIYENITNVNSVLGNTGTITGIGSTVGIGTDLAIKFTLSSTTNLVVGNPIYIFDTKVGNSVTSIYTNDSSIVGSGTTFLDNIYNISGIDVSTGIITCNVHSNSALVGIATTGNVGKFSWGKLSGFTRSSSPVSIAVSGFNVDSGLSTFPTIQRRGFGLRDIGALKKIIP